MTIEGKRVQHKAQGAGVVTALEEDRIQISFDNGSLKKFKFPMGFKRHLKFNDIELQHTTEIEIERLENIGKEEAIIYPKHGHEL